MTCFQPPRDCVIRDEDMTFGFRASAIIIEEGHMLLLRNDHDPYLYTVGGGVQIGEMSHEAVVREVLEEVGAHYDVDRLVMVCEDMWVSDEGVPGHQLDFVYLMRPRGTRDGIWGSSHDGCKTEYVTWVPLDSLGDVDICPDHIHEVDWSRIDDIRGIVRRTGRPE